MTADTYLLLMWQGDLCGIHMYIRTVGGNNMGEREQGAGCGEATPLIK